MDPREVAADPAFSRGRLTAIDRHDRRGPFSVLKPTLFDSSRDDRGTDLKAPNADVTADGHICSRKFAEAVDQLSIGSCRALASGFAS
jgi:hypothetical protein